MKLVQWLTKAIIATSVMVIISTATSLLIVHAYVQQLLVRFGVNEPLQPAELSSVLSAFPGEGARTSGAGEAGEADETNRADGTNEIGETDGKAAEANETAGRGGTGGMPETDDASSPEETESPVHESAPDNALPVMGALLPEENSLYISMEDLNEKKESMTAEDKMDIFTLLITQLPPLEMQKISILMEDGLTAHEMVQASAILQEHLTREEYERLVGILMKYE